MKTIEFKNSVYQEEFFALEEALNYLNKVMNIINSPVLLDNKLRDIPNFFESYFKAEENCSEMISHLSELIGALVADELIKFYTE